MTTTQEIQPRPVAPDEVLEEGTLGPDSTVTLGDRVNAPDGKQLFDAAEYDSEELALPKVDGHGVDKIAVKVSGRIILDRGNPDHVALFRSLTLDRSVELRVAGEVVKTATGKTTNRDGDLDAIVGERQIQVTDIYVLAPEELSG